MSRGIRLLYLTLLGISLLFAWFSIQQLRAMPSDNQSRLWLVVVAMLIFALVITKIPQLFIAVDENLPQKSRTARYFAPVIQGIGNHPVLSSGILVGSSAILLAAYPAFQPWPVLAVWIVGIVMMLVGATSQEGVRRFATGVATWVQRSRWELIAMLSLTILGFLLRGIALDTIPHNIHGDEGEMGLVAQAVIRGELRDPFATSFLSHSTLWFFIQALALRLFGETIGGLRMLSALFGALTIPALYIFARPLYGRTVAIIAAALLAVYHFHVHYSRIGLNNIADSTMVVLTLAAFFYGYNQRSLLGFACAGLFMGLAQYFYFGARLIPVIVLALLVYLALRDRHQFLKLRGHIGLMVIVFILTGGPLFHYYLTHPGVYSGRVMQYGLLQNSNYLKLQVAGQSLFSALIDHAYRTLGFYVAIIENSLFYNAGIPLLDHGMEVLFILSLVLLLLNWHKTEFFVLLLWVGGTALFGGFLLWDYPQSTRYVIAAPALCLLMSLALVQIGTLLSQTVGLPRWLSVGSIAVTVLALMVWNVYFYFGSYTPRNSYGGTHALTEIAYYLRPQAAERYVYMFTHPYFYLNHGTIRFVAKNPAGIDINDPLTSITALPPPVAGLRPLFIFVPERIHELEVVRHQYPDGQLTEYRIQPSNDRTIMYIYEPGNPE